MNKGQSLTVSVSALVASFKENPWEFLYEEDARSFLFAELRRNLPGAVNYTWGDGGLTDEEKKKLGLSQVPTTRVHAEYPLYGFPNRFDLVVLGTEPGVGVWNAPIDVAIELKVGSDRVHMDQCGGFKADLDKLRVAHHGPGERRVSHLGLALYFCQTNGDLSRMEKWFKDFQVKRVTTTDWLSGALEGVFGLLVAGGAESPDLLLQQTEETTDWEERT